MSPQISCQSKKSTSGRLDAVRLATIYKIKIQEIIKSGWRCIVFEDRKYTTKDASEYIKWMRRMDSNQRGQKTLDYEPNTLPGYTLLRICQCRLFLLPSTIGETLSLDQSAIKQPDEPRKLHRQTLPCLHFCLCLLRPGNPNPNGFQHLPILQHCTRLPRRNRDCPIRKKSKLTAMLAQPFGSMHMHLDFFLVEQRGVEPLSAASFLAFIEFFITSLLVLPNLLPSLKLLA